MGNQCSVRCALMLVSQVVKIVAQITSVRIFEFAKCGLDYRPVGLLSPLSDWNAVHATELN